MESSRAAATPDVIVSTGGAGSSHRLSGELNEEPPPKRVRSSDNRVPQGPASMRHLLNVETSTSGVDSHDKAPGNSSSDMCEMTVPRHTEASYVQEVKSKSLPSITVPPHQIFGKGQVPFKHIESLGRGSLALIDKVECTTADATPRKVYVRKILSASRVQNARGLLEVLQASKTFRHQHIVILVLTYEEVDP